MIEDWSALKWYRFYRQKGLRPVNAYMAMLFWKATIGDKYIRIQRISDWINGRKYVKPVEYRQICSNTLTTFK